MTKFSRHRASSRDLTSRLERFGKGGAQDVNPAGLQLIFGHHQFQPSLLQGLANDSAPPPQGILQGLQMLVGGLFHQLGAAFPRGPGPGRSRGNLLHNGADMAFRVPGMGDGGGNRTTTFVPLDYQEGNVQMGHGIFQAADTGGLQYQAGGAHHKEIAQALIKDDLRRHPGVGTTEHRGFGLLAHGQCASQVQ